MKMHINYAICVNCICLHTAAFLSFLSPVPFSFFSSIQNYMAASVQTKLDHAQYTSLPSVMQSHLNTSRLQHEFPLSILVIHSVTVLDVSVVFFLRYNLSIDHLTTDCRWRASLQFSRFISLFAICNVNCFASLSPKTYTVNSFRQRITSFCIRRGTCDVCWSPKHNKQNQNEKKTSSPCICDSIHQLVLRFHVVIDNFVFSSCKIDCNITA